MMNPGKFLKRDGAAILGLVLLTLGFFWSALSGRLIFFHEDFHGLFYPMKYFYMECLRAHRLPLWNPYISCGYPQYAEGQIATFYPLNFLLSAFLPIVQSFNYNVVLHFALAGIFFYLFLRKRHLGIGASFIGAGIFQWSAFMVGHLQHPSIFCSVAWLPLLLYFLEDGLQRIGAGKESFSRALAAGLVLAIQILVGYPPIVFYSLMIALIYLIGRGVNLRKTGLGFKAPCLFFLLILAVGLSLSTLQWLPTADLTRNSERVTLARTLYMTGFSMDPRHLVTFIFPHYLGSAAFGTYVGQKFYWEVCAYLGLLSLLLIALAVIKRWQQSWPLVGLALIGLVLALGRLNASDSNPIVNPIYNFLQFVPPFNLFRAAGRYLLFWTVAGAALAAEGVQFLLDKSAAGEKRRTWPAWLLTGGLLITWVVLQFYYYRRLPAHAPRPAVLPAEWLILGCGLLLFASLVWAAKKGTAKIWLVGVLAAATLADLFAFGKPLAPLTDPGFHRIVPWTARRIMEDKSWYRVWPWRTSQKGDPFYGDPYPWALTRKYYLWDADRLMPNLNIPWRMHTVSGNAAFMREMDYAVHLTESEIYPRIPKGYVYFNNLAHLLGVKYFLLRQADPHLELIEQRGKLWLYRNPDALPRAWVVGAAQVIEDPKRAGKVALGSLFDPRAVAVVEEPLPASLNEMGEVPSDITWQDPRPEKIILHTKTAKAGLLVLSEIYDLNWDAKIDGQATPLYRTDWLLRGVYLPAGEHQVEFLYNNIYISSGLRLSLVALLFWLLAAWRGPSRRQNALAAPAPDRPKNPTTKSGRGQ
jgi:hypothetical protein